MVRSSSSATWVCTRPRDMYRSCVIDTWSGLDGRRRYACREGLQAARQRRLLIHLMNQHRHRRSSAYRNMLGERIVRLFTGNPAYSNPSYSSTGEQVVRVVTTPGPNASSPPPVESSRFCPARGTTSRWRQRPCQSGLRFSRHGVVKLSEVGAVDNHISLMRHI